MKLDNGWLTLGPVCKHPAGFKVHVLGYIGYPSGTILSASALSQRDAVTRAIRIQGGNRKRGLMLWAQQVYRASL